MSFNASLARVVRAPPAGDHPEDWRTTNPITGGHQAEHCRPPYSFNFARLFRLSIAFEGDLAEVAYAAGGASLASWFRAVVLLPYRSRAIPYAIWKEVLARPYNATSFPERVTSLI